MAETKKKTIEADSSNPMRTIVNLWPYMWPSGRPDLKQGLYLGEEATKLRDETWTRIQAA